MKAIEIKDFTKIYRGKIKGIDSLSLNIEKGSFFGLLGPNGAGKSTTVNLIAGSIKKQKGELKILGEVITESSYLYKGKIGFVLEKPLYFAKLTGEEYLRFTGQMYNLDKKTAEERANELLDYLELQDKRKKFIETYSAGMKKKVSFAAALIHDPEILILDEPFEGIDPVSSKKIREVLTGMVKKGKTIILTSHILEIVEKLCDEIAIINRGKLVFQDKTESIKNMIKNGKENKQYESLEELFHDLVGNEKETNTLSWL